MLFPFTWDHPYSWRTNLRCALPGVFGWLLPKGKDCESAGSNHVWYNEDGIHSACYHCSVVREAQLWKAAESEIAKD